MKKTFVSILLCLSVLFIFGCNQPIVGNKGSDATSSPTSSLLPTSTPTQSEYEPASSSSPTPSATHSPIKVAHVCEVSGCGKEGIHSIVGISGATEYYCTSHYNEMEDMLQGMYDDVHSSKSPTEKKYGMTDKEMEEIADMFGVSPDDLKGKIDAVSGE